MVDITGIGKLPCLFYIMLFILYIIADYIYEIQDFAFMMSYRRFITIKTAGSLYKC